MARKKIQNTPKKGQKGNIASDHQPKPQDSEDDDGSKGSKKNQLKNKHVSTRIKKINHTTKQKITFSDQFKQQVSKFKAFLHDFVNLKASKSGMHSQEIDKISQDLSKKIEASAKKVLKEELSNGYRWINLEKKSLEDIKKKLQHAEEEATKLLQKDEKNYSADEIQDKVETIKKKIATNSKENKQLDSVLEIANYIYKDQIHNGEKINQNKISNDEIQNQNKNSQDEPN